MKNKVEKAQGKHRWLWILLWVAGGLFLLALGAALLIASLLFGKGTEFPVEPLRQEDYALAGKLTGKLLNEIRAGKPQEVELVLSPAEVASLLRIADNGATVQTLLKGESPGKNRTKPHNIRFENGRFEIVAPVETGLGWLWGGIITVDMSVRPEKTEDGLRLDIFRMRAGALSVPDSIVENMRGKSLDEVKKREEYREFDRCVKSVRVDDGHNLRIVYRPAEIDRLLPAETRRLLFLPPRKK